MAKEVILTPTAEANYENITDYLLGEWEVSILNNFIDRFDQVMTTLSKDPGRFPLVDKNNSVQRCIITKHNIVYFTETEHNIKILTIFDTRQDPSKSSILFFRVGFLNLAAFLPSAFVPNLKITTL